MERLYYLENQATRLLANSDFLNHRILELEATISDLNHTDPLLQKLMLGACDPQSLALALVQACDDDDEGLTAWNAIQYVLRAAEWSGG